MSDDGHARRRAIRGYVVGYGVALVLTAAAFAAVRWPVWRASTTLSAIFALGLAQMVVHFRWFLHIGQDRSSRDHLALLLFSALIIALMVSGTLVLLLNLHARMMS